MTDNETLHERLKRQRARVLAFATNEWQKWDFLPEEDGPAEMIAINELAREGAIEFDPQWRLRCTR